MNRLLKLAIAVGAQTLALVTIIAINQWTLATGTPIVLETRPIDPRSLFRGDYVRLNYTINNLPRSLPGADKKYARGERVYVLIRQGAPYWKAVSIHRNRPKLPPDHVVIKGEVKTSLLFRSRLSGGLSVRYGIENYFVPEGEGRALERPKPGEKITIRVAVDSFGNSAIKAVLVNGRPRYVETLF